MTRKFCDLCGEPMDKMEDIRYIKFIKLVKDQIGDLNEIPTHMEVECCSICHVKIIETVEAYRDKDNNK